MKPFNSSAYRRTFSLLTTALLLCILLSASAPVRAVSDDLPKPVWENACKSPFKACSKVEVYQYWGERPRDRLTVWVDALTNDPNNKGILTVWLLMDDPDLELPKELLRNDFNVMVVYPRGTKLSTTHYICADEKTAHDDQCWVSEKCAANLAARSANKDDLLNASHFSADQVAHDLDWILHTLGDGRKNVLLTQGLSSIFALRLLQLHDKVPVGVLAMDFVHPLLFDTYGYLGGMGQDIALQHILALCDDDVACVGRLGAIEGSWARFQTLMALAKSNKLTCAKELKWSSSKLWGSSFADQFRSVLASMLRYPTYPFLTSKADLINLIPSFLYRLQRCKDVDIVALNALYNYVTSAKGFTCSEDIYVQTHWLLNEFTQMAPPKNADKYWSGEANRRMLVPAASNINAFHTGAGKFPTVPRSSASKVLPVNATQKILFLSADMDPLAPRGAASAVAIAFKQLGAGVEAVQLRGIVNQPSAVLTPCIINNLKFYRGRSEWADADQCTVETSKKLDFLKCSTKDYYGTDDAWDYDSPNSDDGSSRGGGAGGDGGGATGTLKKVFRFLLIVIVIGALGGASYYAYNYVRDRGFNFRFHRVSDNFYDNIHN